MVGMIYSPSKRNGLGFLVLLSAFLFFPTRADATVVKAMTLEEKTNASAVVVHAIVERVRVEWEIPDAKIQTMITVKVIEAIKGANKAGDLITMRRGGGTIDGITMTAAGLSTYETGEEVILFLEPLPLTPLVLTAIGVGIGKYDVEMVGNETWVDQHANVTLAYYEKGKPMRLDHPPLEGPLPLHEFLKRVRSYVRGIPVRPVANPKGAALKKPLPLSHH